MNHSLNIIPECYVDTIVVETLLNLNCSNHQKGIGMVLKTIEYQFKDKIAIGFIDDDKNKPSSYNDYITIGESNHFLVKCHKKIPYHFLIVIKPAQEVFILSVCEETNVNLEDFNLSNNLDELKRITKSQFSKENHDLKRLFKQLKNQGEIKKLKSVLDYILTNSFKANPNEIKELLLSKV